MEEVDGRVSEETNHQQTISHRLLRRGSGSAPTQTPEHCPVDWHLVPGTTSANRHRVSVPWQLARSPAGGSRQHR